MLPFMRRTISTHMLVFASGWIFVIPRTDKVAAKDLRASKKVESAPQDEGRTTQRTEDGIMLLSNRHTGNY